MSRPLSSSGGAAVTGRIALRMPAGDPVLLRARAAGLRRLEAEARHTPLMRGALARQLPQIWTGQAAAAAVAESTLLVGRAGRVLDALPEASAALTRYATALDQVRAAVARLQRQWDDETTAHTQAVATTRSQAVLDVAAAQAIARLTNEHEAVKSRLSRQHAELLTRLRHAAAVAARAVEAASDRTFPSHGEPAGSVLRDRLFAGLAFAEGAAAAGRSRQAALGDATALRRMLGSGSGAGSNASAPGAVTDLLSSIRGRVDDPVYAQAVVDELGVSGIHGLLAELSRSGSSVGPDGLREATGLLGRLLLTAANPNAAGHLDPRTEQLVSSNAALLRDSVIASLGREVADSAGSDRYVGYWLTGQLVACARRAGWVGAIAPGFLQRLVAGTAQAEVAETRDDDLWRRHGTTIEPNGSEQFTSFFDDANRSGDALHVLLSEVGNDPVERLELLNASFDGGILTDTRGRAMTVAAYLARRFVTYNANGPATNTDLHLATGDDLARLMRESSADGSELVATLRAKVMAEVGRVSGLAQQGVSTAAQYERNTSGIENEAVDWALAMPANVTRALNTPGLGMDSDEYASVTGDGYQPVLSVGELSSLVGAFTLARDFSAGAKDPAANYTRLIASSVAAARNEAASGRSVDEAIQRLAFFDTAASWSLIGLSRQQDGLNASMWTNLAEATNFVAATKKGPKAFTDHVKTLIKDRSTLSADEKLLISVLRSNVELKQSVANEERTAALTALLGGIRPTAPAGAASLKVVMTSGSNRLTPLPTAAPVALARAAEIDAALRAARGRRDATLLQLTQQLTPAQPALMPGATFVLDPLTGGSIDRSHVRKVLPHEMATAERLMRAGHHIEFIPATGVGPSPDAWVDGEAWEFKALTGLSVHSLERAIRRGRGQAPRVIIDATASPLSADLLLLVVDRAVRRYRGVEIVRIIMPDGEILERKP